MQPPENSIDGIINFGGGDQKLYAVNASGMLNWSFTTNYFINAPVFICYTTAICSF